MRTRIKICCISSKEEAQRAIDAGADALGLVARMPSGPGPISDELIAEITDAIPAGVSSFLLTAEERAEAIAAHAERTGAAVIQVVSHIEPTESAKLKSLLPGRRVVQVVHVEDESSLDRIDAYAPHAHALLLDSGRPSLKTPELGGTGRTHDWQVSARCVAKAWEAGQRPVFLAGGLNAENVGDAIRTVRPFGVDICSGVRTNGSLDADKLRAFVRAVRQADAEHA